MYPTTTQAAGPIEAFDGPYAFLSNFYPSAVEVYDHDYPTVEHAFQAAKSTDPAIRAQIQAAPTPNAAKRLGRRLTLRADWDTARDGVMLRLVEQKFIRHPELGAQLLATAPRALIEGNNWGDRYWGVCEGEGENRLGQILVTVRAVLLDAVARGQLRPQERA